MSDLRDAFRALRATPIVTIVAILSLALGIGANSAIFSIVDSLLLRSLPVQQPERLAMIMRDSTVRASSWTNPIWEQIRDRRHDLFETAFAYSIGRFNLAQGGETKYAEGLYVSGDYFSGLGVPPMLGRLLTVADDTRGGGPDGPVAVVSYSYWQRQFGGAADAIGKTIVIERAPFTIVGVTTPGFFGVDVGRSFDVAIPLASEAIIRGKESSLDRRSSWWLRIMARLKDGQSAESAEQALRGVQPQIREATMPQNYSETNKERYLKPGLSVQMAQTGASGLRNSYQTPILTLMAVVGLVLLIACANIANLLLARAAARQHEFSLRLALGAPRRRLVRQLLAESLMLSGAGALLGLLLARWGSVLLVRQLSTQGHLVSLDLQLDWRVLGFTTLVAVVTALLFGIVPAVRAARAEPMDAIREHGRGAAGDRRFGLGNVLVAGQVALSLVLVVGAGLFLRTFGSLATLDLGFERDPLLIVEMDARKSRVEPAQRADLYARVLDAVRTAPGVARASLSPVSPVSGSIWNTNLEVENAPPSTERDRTAYLHLVAPDWFATYGTRLIQGRDVSPRDTSSSPHVVLVNETFVRTFFKDGQAIGRRVRQSGGPPTEVNPWAEVIGVVRDAVYVQLREPVPPTMYFALAQQDELPSVVNVAVRAAQGKPALLARGVAEAIGRIDGDLALTFTPLAEQVDAALVQERIVALLSSFFGALALLLAGLGLYGVTAHAVSRRRGEIGIRMALGATAMDVVRMVVTRVGGLVLAGIVSGAALAFWASRFVEPLLFGLRPRDVSTFAVASVVLAGVGVLAGWLPARRAARIDPARVLRDE